jgi:hypothetical protein
MRDRVDDLTKGLSGHIAPIPRTEPAMHQSVLLAQMNLAFDGISKSNGIVTKRVTFRREQPSGWQRR